MIENHLKLPMSIPNELKEIRRKEKRDTNCNIFLFNRYNCAMTNLPLN